MISRLRHILSTALTPPLAQTQWDAFQSAAEAEIRAARARHAPVRHIEARRREIVHAALRGGVDADGGHAT